MFTHVSLRDYIHVTCCKEVVVEDDNRMCLSLVRQQKHLDLGSGKISILVKCLKKNSFTVISNFFSFVTDRELSLILIKCC